MIKMTVDPGVLARISQAIVKVKGIDYTPEQFFWYMINGIKNKDMMIFVDNDEKLDAFAVVSLISQFNKEELFIDMTYINPKTPKLAGMMMDSITQFANKIRVKTLSAMITRGLKAFNKRYGFSQKGIYITKELERSKVWVD